MPTKKEVMSSEDAKNLANGKFLRAVEYLIDNGGTSIQPRQLYDETIINPSDIQQGMREAQIEMAQRKKLAERANRGNYLCHNYI